MSKAEKFMFSFISVGSCVGILITILLSSCTLSYQNIHTQGHAEDLVDQEQTAEPDVHPDTSIPISLTSIPAVNKAL